MEVITKSKGKGLFICLFKIPVYDSKICFIRYENDSSYAKALKFCEKMGLFTDEYNEDEWKNAYGFTFKERTTSHGYVHFLLINKSKEYIREYTNTLAHENYHLIEQIAVHHGLTREDNEPNEHIAYLTGYLFNLLSKF
jgi:hypothetical protein